MKIPFGKPFPAIDPVSLRDGTAAGLVNGYMDELGSYRIVPGLTVLGEFDGETTFPPTVEGSSRIWDGQTANYLQTPLHGTFVGPSCQFAWIKVASLNSKHTIFGNSYDAGYGMRISASNRLEMFWSNGIISDFNTISAALPDLAVGVPLFVAVNIISSITPVVAHFYAGLTPSTVALLATVAGGPTIYPNGVVHVALGVNMYGLTPEYAFDGQMAKVGRYQINLTLEELQAIAVCGATPTPLGLFFYYEMTGEDPEPDLGPFGYHAAVIGTLPVTGGLC